jgi:hypothetical protein
MSAKDLFHNSVKIALVKDNWKITHDPFPLSFGGVDMSIDLGAEKLIAAEKENQRIAVEIKSFLEKNSAIYQFHTALGQFVNYRSVLKREDPERVLFLAIPVIAYKSFFSLEFTQIAIEENSLKIIVYDIYEEVIVLWKN